MTIQNAMCKHSVMGLKEETASNTVGKKFAHFFPKKN